MGFGRRVVTGSDGIASDGPAPLTVDVDGGFGVSELLWLDGPVRTVADGADRTDGGFPLEPPPGGASSRLIRMPNTGEWLRVDGDDDDATPGMHATDTLDLMVVVEGEIVLGTADGSEAVVRAGDAVVQRGTAHRWRVGGDGPCTYWVTMLRPAAGAGSSDMAPRAGAFGRRLVTGGDGVVECPAAVGIGAVYDVWQTGGPLGAVDQGGDPDGPWALGTPAGSVALRLVQMPPGPPTDGGWHTTPTIDIDLILSGRVAMELDGDITVELGPGDSVVQRGTNHRWWVVGDEPASWAAIMWALPDA